MTVTVALGSVKMTTARTMNVKHVTKRNERRCDQTICKTGAVIVLGSMIHQEVIRRELNVPTSESPYGCKR